MASSSSDRPSTSGRRSGLARSSDQDHSVRLPTPKLYTSEFAELDNVILEVKNLNTKRVRSHALNLTDNGIGLDDVVEAVFKANPETERMGPLHAAAFENHLDICMMLIEEFKCDPNFADADGTTPLLYAIFGGGCQEVFEYLIKSGADPSKADNRGMTPLHFAAGHGKYEIAKYLLDSGVNVDPINFEGEAPLHIAAIRGHARIVRLLFQHGADLNRQTHELVTPLVAAIFGSSSECLHALMQIGADVSSDSPVTPLSVAARIGSPYCIQFFVDNDANVNELDVDGKLPVQIAASRGFRECVEMLIDETDPLENYPDWSPDYMLQREKTAFKLEASMAIEEGDARYWEKEYALAVTCYNKAMRLGYEDADLFAKRGLCHLGNRDAQKYLKDAMNYMHKMKPNSSKEDAKKLVLEFGKKWKKPKTG